MPLKAVKPSLHPGKEALNDDRPSRLESTTTTGKHKRFHLKLITLTPSFFLLILVFSSIYFRFSI